MGTLRVAHDAASVAVARRRLVTELASRGLPSCLLDDVALVVSELVGNAVRHGAPLPDGGGVLVVWDVAGPYLRLEVCDGGGGPEGVGHDAGDLPTASTSAEGGRGLAIVATLATRWGTSVRGAVTCVQAELPIAQPEQRYATA